MATSSRARKPLVLDPSLVLNAILTNPHVVCYACDIEGRYVAVSRGYGDLLGVVPADCIGRTAAEFLPADLAAYTDEVNRRVLESGQPTATEESPIIRGVRRHFVIHRIPIRDQDGTIVGVFGFSTEHTHRVRLLHETEVMNQVLGLSSHATTLESYAEGLLEVLSTETGCRMLGVRAMDATVEPERSGNRGREAAPFIAQRGFPEDLVEQAREPRFLASACPCAAVLRGDAAALAPAALDEDGCLVLHDMASLRGGVASSVAAWMPSGLGTLAILPLRHHDEPLGCLVVGDPEPGRLRPEAIAFLHRLLPPVAEAIQRFAVERRLEASRSKLQSVVHSLPLPVWIVDAHYRVVFRNEAHVAHFGPALEAATCFATLQGRKAPCPECDFPETLMRTTTRREWRDPRTDRTYDLIAVPYDSMTGERQRLEVFFDVTDRVRMEAQLRQTQRLDSLGSLAAGIAHDFNNILAGIIGYAQLGMQRSPPDTDCAQVLEQVGQIAERGAELTRKILAFSRRQSLKVVPLDLNALVTDLRTMILPLAGDRVEVVLDLEEGLWVVQGDASQIEQVVLNLCVNAVEAMPGGGRLTIRTRNLDGEFLRRALASRLRPSTEPSPVPEPTHGVLIEVSDTGHGMSAEVMSQAIEPFFTTKGRGRGTGLGLSVSYGIVQQHRGTMAIESAVGVGTTVRVCLPSMGVTPSRVARPGRESRPASQLHSVSHCGPVLVVEDDPPIRGLVATLLGELGIEARTAASGAEALEVISSDPTGVRMVLTDVAMPGMNGVTLARRIRDVRPDLPIVFMSGCSDSTLEQYGVTDEQVLLRKPFTLQDLSQAIQAAVSRGS